MSIMQRVTGFFQRENVDSLPMWGPLFLLPTLALATKGAIAFDILLLALAGFYLSARFQMRGFVYALVLLGVSAVVKHSVATDHLWQLGLEGSLGVSFLITSLAFEQSSLFTQSLNAQIETRAATLQNLEEEFAKNTELTQAQQIAAQEKLSQIQKELEELQSEHSSILILNEVLRKSNGRTTQEAQALNDKVIDQQREMALLRSHCEETQKELDRLKEESAIIQQNGELFDELNAVRYQKEQADILNETVARLQQREYERAKKAEFELAAAQEQAGRDRIELKMLGSHLEKMSIEVDRARTLAAQHNEVAMQRNFLSERLQAYELEIQQLKARSTDPDQAKALFAARDAIEKLQVEKGSLEAELLVASGKVLDLERAIAQSIPHLEFEKTLELLAALEREKNELKQRLEGVAQERDRLQEKIDDPTLSYELEQLKESLSELAQEKIGLEEQLRAAKPNAHFLEQMEFFQEKAKALTELEPLYKQLKKQFEEKNGVLHKTRSELFKVDTDLQALRIEKEQEALQASLFPEEIREELETLDRAYQRLEEENQLLEELVSQLSAVKLEKKN